MKIFKIVVFGGFFSKLWQNLSNGFVFSRQKIHQKWLFTLMLRKKDQISSDSVIIQYQRLLHRATNAASRVFFLNEAPVVNRFICVPKKIASYKFRSRRRLFRGNFRDSSHLGSQQNLTRTERS